MFVLCSDAAPGDGGRVALAEDGDGVAVDHQLAVGGGDLALVLAVGGVIPTTWPPSAEVMAMSRKLLLLITFCPALTDNLD